MQKRNPENPVITGTPLIGEGNIVDVKAFMAYLAEAGIPTVGFYPDGMMVRHARLFHRVMSMSTKKTMSYAFKSEGSRSSLMVRPLRWELRAAIGRVYRRHPDARCLLTSQSIVAEESIGYIGTIPTIMSSSDVYGKFSYGSDLSPKQRRIIHLVWNSEAFHFYRNKLALRNVYLTVPVDPLIAFEEKKGGSLTCQGRTDDSNCCYIKLSGSGGDGDLVQSAITSLWEKSRVKSLVFPGTEKTRRKIFNTIGKGLIVDSSMDSSLFYKHIRGTVSNRIMLLAYPSEQVKHVAILTQNNVFPNVAWLPPRGKHEVMNLLWAIQKGFSGTICIPAEYQRQLHRALVNLGAPASKIKLVVPGKLSAEHFMPSPPWQYEPEAEPLETIVRRVTGQY